MATTRSPDVDVRVIVPDSGLAGTPGGPPTARSWPETDTFVVVSGSVALLGDTMHNLADALTAVPLLVAFTLARRPPTKRYTYGYGRAEDLGGLFVIAMITLSSALAAFEAITRLIHPRTVTHLPIVAAAAVVGFLGNEVVARYRIRVGRHTLRAEVDVTVDPGISLVQAHDIAHHAEAHLLYHVRRLTAATVHASPEGAHP